MRVIVELGYIRILLRPGVSVDTLVNLLEGAVEVDKIYDKGRGHYTTKGSERIPPPTLIADDQVVEPSTAQESDGIPI